MEDDWRMKLRLDGGVIGWWAVAGGEWVVWSRPTQFHSRNRNERYVATVRFWICCYFYWRLVWWHGQCASDIWTASAIRDISEDVWFSVKKAELLPWKDLMAVCLVLLSRLRCVSAFISPVSAKWLCFESYERTRLVTHKFLRLEQIRLCLSGTQWK